MNRSRRSAILNDMHGAHGSWRGWLVWLCLAASADGSRAANLLADPGFETSAAGSSIAGWQSYGVNHYVINDVAHARSGTNYFKVYGAFNAQDNYTGIYQDMASGPGGVYAADGWAYSLSSDAIHGQDQVWIEATFRDAGANTLALYRSDIITGANIANYGGLSAWFDLKVTNQWSFTNSGGAPVGIAMTGSVANLAAPAGTAFVRYQTVFHQGPDNANGSAYLDDCSLTQISAPTNTAGTAWNIVWSDEFNGASVNTGNWTFETGNNNGWGNSELEYYTGRTQNAYVSNGLLHIVARQESMGGFNYTSARMKTQGHFNKAYGRFEWRAKLPAGLGYWPALWLLGSNITTVSWPACGEIDVMENKGSALGQVQGTIHYSDAANNHLQSTGYYNFPSGDSVTNFHNYMLEWSTNVVRWYVDSQLYETQTSWSSSTGPYPAPFNQPFFIIMNLAIGGAYLGKPSTNTINANTVFPGDMQVDYVRVWDLTPPLQISFIRTNANTLLSWPTNIVCHLQSLTNSLGVTGTWVDLSGASNPYAVPTSSGGSAVFYRLQSP